MLSLNPNDICFYLRVKLRVPFTVLKQNKEQLAHPSHRHPLHFIALHITPSKIKTHRNGYWNDGLMIGVLNVRCTDIYKKIIQFGRMKISRALT